MEYSSQRSKKPLFIIAGVVLALIIVVIAVIMALGGSPKQQAATTTKDGTDETVATKEQVQKNLDDVESSIKQATADQATAKASLNNGDKQIKVGQ